ncbi:chromosome segregation in meiosis-related protein [Ceratocystis pirilliformis]|uniref:Chromosome segregation in meiosis protein n=1 Tax=Ceratocystis pirilliformis TaxID=259994 RepID=A0ABR3YMB6_9PEZI
MMSSPSNLLSHLEDYGFNETLDLGEDVNTTDVVGIDDEIKVSKRSRAPAVKLDEARLLSENGIPKLKRRARKLRFRGKGHEWSDASNLLSMYRLWLDDLYPKARFVDALAMVEKAGRKGTLVKQRNAWLEESGKTSSIFDTVDEILKHNEPDGTAIQLETAVREGRPVGSTESLSLDNDISSASPTRPQANMGSSGRPTTAAATDKTPDFDDDLEAMMAEAENFDRTVASHEQGLPTTHPGELDFSVEDELMAEMPFED